MDIEIQVTGVHKSELMLSAAKRAVEGRTTTFSQIGKHLAKFFSGQVFASRGGVIDEPWPKLDAAYAAWKAKHYPGAIPLVRTGKMQHGFRYQAGPNFVRMYNTAKYFKYHQSDEPREKIPRRVMMKVDDQRRQDIAVIIAENIREEIIRAS